MNMVRRILASLFSVIFVIFFIPSILFISLLNTFLNPNFYYTNFLDQSYEIALPYVTESIKENNKELFKNFTDEEINGIVAGIFDKELFRGIVINFIYEIKNIKNSDKIEISLKSLQDKTPEMTDEIAKIYISKIKECSGDEEDINILNCRPKGITDEKLTNLMAIQMSENFLNIIPENIEIKEAEDAQIFDFLRSLDTYKMIAYFTIFTSLSLLLIIVGLLIFKPLKKVIRYISADLMVGPILTILFILLGRNILINRLIENNLEGNPDFYSLVSMYYSKEIIKNSIIILIIGTVLFVISFLLQNFSKGKIPEKVDNKEKVESAAQKPTAAPKADEPQKSIPQPTITKIHIEPKIEPKPENPPTDINNTK
jgi:hypothetical protein